MSNSNQENMVVALDIGTSKVVAIVGAVGATGDLEIIGTGMGEAAGGKKGVGWKMESTVKASQRA